MPGKISFGALKIENIPTPVLVVLLGVITIGGMTYAYRAWMKDPELALVTAKQANARLQAEVIEYGQHAAEAPESVAVLRNDARGKLTVAAFPDECSIISLVKGGKARSKLILSLAREVEASRLTTPPFDIMTVYAAGRCWNPHPGEFKTWYGDRDGEWIQVWRQWPDGCKHVQMFNTVRGVWDTNRDGTPKVTWTSCVH